MVLYTELGETDKTDLGENKLNFDHVSLRYILVSHMEALSRHSGILGRNQDWRYRLEEAKALGLDKVT